MLTQKSVTRTISGRQVIAIEVLYCFTNSTNYMRRQLSQ
jgi:hypothetical protein